MSEFEITVILLAFIFLGMVLEHMRMSRSCPKSGELKIDFNHFDKPAFIINLNGDIREITNHRSIILQIEETDLRNNFKGYDED